MNIIYLSPFDLVLASMLILLMAALTFIMRLDIAKQVLIAGLRTTVQLLFVGFVLKALFAQAHFIWMICVGSVMLLVAAREVSKRQQRRFTGPWGFGLGGISMFISSFTIIIITLIVIIQADPWYKPQYAIPLLGMMLGNTMTGVALGLDRLTQNSWQQRSVIEGRLMMGQNWSEAISDIRNQSIKSGMIPIINSMAIAGIVSLPGMMTGQILGGSPPQEAVKYQILIMFIISSGTGFGTMAAVWLGSRRLFDKRERLRLDRLKTE